MFVLGRDANLSYLYVQQAQNTKRLSPLFAPRARPAGYRLVDFQSFQLEIKGDFFRRERERDRKRHVYANQSLGTDMSVPVNSKQDMAVRLFLCSLFFFCSAGVKLSPAGG